MYRISDETLTGLHVCIYNADLKKKFNSGSDHHCTSYTGIVKAGRLDCVLCHQLDR